MNERTYKVIKLSPWMFWGFEVNHMCDTGMRVKLNDDCDDRFIINALRQVGALRKRVHAFTCEHNDDVIYIDRYGKPVFQLHEVMS